MHTSFIKNEPIGEDFFDGKSQQKLAQNIVSHIISIDKMSDSERPFSNLIGLEGSWGSGKSNVLKQMEKIKSFSDGYHMFVYDTWGHQEDLLHRSILETLTTHLIKENILKDKGIVKLRNGSEKQDSWTNLLSYLLSNKTTTTTHNNAKVSKFVLCMLFVGILLNAVSFYISELIPDCIKFSSWRWLYFVPYVLGFIVFIGFRLKRKNFAFLYEWITQTEDDEVIEQYTSEEEPSVQEFKNWMQAISDNISNSKKLVVVFDNMDRLPSDKVKQLWSSIYTFFAGESYSNIWVIIPFDEEHLCKAFGEKDGDDLCRKFLKKTFPVLFKVSPPIISDYEGLFKSYYQKAFDDTIAESRINQIYRVLQPNPNPRDIIYFLNQLVLLYKQWGEKIDLADMSLYVLRAMKGEFRDDEKMRLDNYLLSDKMFTSVENFFVDKGSTKINISALVYGLEDKSLAAQLPLRNELNNILNGESAKSLNEYVDEPFFMTVLTDLINRTALDCYQVINVVGKLNEEKISDADKENLTKKWDYLANECVRSIEVEKYEFNESLKILLQKCSFDRKKFVVSWFYEGIYGIEKFKGTEYVNVLSTVNTFLEESIPEVTLPEFKRKDVEASEFIKYVLAAKGDYKKYNVHTDNTLLVKYLKDKKLSKEIDVSFIDTIRDDSEYNFDNIKDYCTTMISTIAVDENNLLNIIYLNRVLETNKTNLVNTQLKQCVQKIAESNLDKNALGYEDYIFIQEFVLNAATNISEELFPRLETCVDSYIDLSSFYTSSDDAQKTSFCKYLIEHDHNCVLDASIILPNYVQMQQTYGVQWDILLKYLSSFIDDDSKLVEIIKTNPSKYLPQTVLNDVLNVDCKFTDLLIKTTIAFFNGKTKEFIVAANGNVIDEYVRQFYLKIIGTKYMEKLDKHLTEQFEVILELRLKNQSLNPQVQELEMKMTKFVNLSLLTPFLNEKRNSFVSGNTSPQVFKQFEEWFRELDNDVSNPKNFIQFFVAPAYMADKECREIVSVHLDFYVPLIIEAREFVTDLYEYIENNKEAEEISQLAKKLNI